jgi:predicted porin
MKKLVIASAVAAVMASSAAFAENTVYGKVGISVQLNDKDTPELDADGDPTGNLYDAKRQDNVSSRIGFKGKYDLGNGMSSFYRYEAGTSEVQGGGVSTRLLYAGVEGDFGQVGVGNQWTPSYTLVRGNHDPFNTIGCNLCGGNYGAGFRTDNALWYLNTFGEVTFAAAIVAFDTTDKLNDATDVAVSVPVGPVTVGVGYQKLDSRDKAQTTLNVGYKTGDFSIDAGFFQTDLADDWTIVTAHYMGFTAQIEDDGNDSQTNLGYNYAMGKNTTLFAEVSSGDVGQEETNVGIVVLF